jgi:hypothetical protein
MKSSKCRPDPIPTVVEQVSPRGPVGRPRRADHPGHHLQAFLAHRLGENRIRLPKRIDAVDQVNVEIADAQGILAYVVDPSAHIDGFDFSRQHGPGKPGRG